ncbi:MAG: hypothetical protein M1511_14690 [Deltaproteobacteria bacterium]|nr:hypothetical protein [Deltaproteobacteria bacterium]
MNYQIFIKQKISNLWLLGGGLLAYCVVLTIMSGNFGFDGDDWWVLGWAYWHSFPMSILGYAREFLRPMEGVYYISMFELFGFSPITFHLFSLLLLAFSCLLMGKCLSKCFPYHPGFVTISTVTAFFLPMVSSLTYIVFTDNSRISLVLFWGAVLAFQFWAEKPFSSLRLIAPVCLYLMSFMTYEAPSLLIFVIPLFLWPIHMRHRTISDTKFLTVLGLAIFVSFAGAIILRYTLMSGGVIDAAGLTTSTQLVWSYLALLPFYLVAPFKSLPEKFWPVLVGIFVTIWIIVIICATQNRPTDPGSGSPRRRAVGTLPHETLYIVLTGLGILFLGMAPYQIAGYGSSDPKIADTVLAKWGMIYDPHPAWFNFNEASRIYSSASYGIAILIAVTTTVWKRTTVRNTSQILAATAIGCMATFHAGLSFDWKEASVIRNQLLSSLITKAPSVQNGTNFVFVDLELYHKRAAVIRGWSGLRELMRMLYNDPTLGAWYIYPSNTAWPNTSHQQAIALPNGLISRGIELDHPAPKNSLLIFRRLGTNLDLLKKLSTRDAYVKSGVSWQRCGSLKSNPERITQWCHVGVTHRQDSKNPWNTGLISCLGLTTNSIFKSAPQL